VSLNAKTIRRSAHRAKAMLLSVAWLFGSIGCGTGTDLNQLVNVEPLSDASPAASGDGGSFQDPFGGAPPYSAQTGSSSHNAGMSCTKAGCHGSIAAASSFLIGGTVYVDYKGTTPAPGLEVRIVDSAGHAASAYSGPEGNFYIMSANASAVTFPAVVGARGAQGTRPMITTLAVNMGSCGQTPCHLPGGGPLSSTGNYYPIHVP